MRLRHALPVAAAATGLVLLTGGQALAAYPPTIGTGRVSRSVVAPGRVVAFCGTGYAPKTVVTIKIDGRYFETVRTGGSGRFCAAVRMGASGHHTVSSWGTDAGTSGRRILVALVTVRPKPHGHQAGAAASPAAAPAMSPVAASTGHPAGSRLTAAEMAALVSAGLILTGAATGYRVAARRRE